MASLRLTATPDTPYKLSTHRHWVFKSEGELDAAREARREVLSQKRKIDGPSVVPRKTLTLHEENVLLLHFQRKLMEACVIIKDSSGNKIHETVEASALAYFKRYYLRHRICTSHNPFDVIVACLLLAGKTEEQRDPLVLYKICASLSFDYERKKDDLLAKELELLEALEFKLRVYHPYGPMRSLLRSFLQTIDGEFDASEAFEENVRGIVRYAMLSDCPFLFSPGQIALAALELACTNQSSAFNHLNVAYEKFVDTIVDTGAHPDSSGYAQSKLCKVIETVKTKITEAQEVPDRDSVEQLCASVDLGIPGTN